MTFFSAKLSLNLSLCLVLAACNTVGPQYQTPVSNLPNTFSTALPTAQQTWQADWWRTFDDAQLNQLIAAALQDSPDMAVALARLQQARSVQRIQDASSAPVAAVGAKVASDKISKNSEMFANLPVKNVNTDFTNHQIGFDASWEIDLFGRQQRISEAAQAKLEASAARVHDVRLMLAAEVARNYFELISNQHRRAIAERNLSNFSEALRLAKLAYRLGDSGKMEVERAQLAQDQFRANLPALEMAIQQNYAALMVLTQRSLPMLQSQLVKAHDLTPLPSAPHAGLPSELLQRRADLRIAERELAAASAEIGVAEAALYPRFSLTGNGGWTSIAAGSLLQSASRNWSIGPQISMPLFNGAKLKGQVAVQKAAYEASLAAYRKAVLNALADVEVALNRLAQSEQRHQSVREAETAQKNMLALLQKQLRAGEISKIPVLEGEKALLVQEDGRIQAHAQSLLAMVSVYKALGGGWQLE